MDSKENFKLFGLSVAWVLGILVVVIGLSFGGLWLSAETSLWRGEKNREIQINAAEYQRESYSHFFDLCVSVQNAENMVDIQSAQLEQTTDEGQKGIIRTNISGNQAARAKGINQYNGDSAQDEQIGKFKDPKLPPRLSTEAYEAGGTKTQCAV